MESGSGAVRTHGFDGRGFRLAYVHEGVGGRPLLLVHGWPETKRIWWRVIEPLVAAGFEVIAPDLRNFGESDVAPDGFGDVASSSRDLHALVHDHLGHDRVVLVGRRLRWPDHPGHGPAVRVVRRPHGALQLAAALRQGPHGRACGRRPQSAHDYFLRQGTDADALAAELATPEQRRRYIATFYSSRFWAHPGAFDDAAIAFHTEPFADGAKLRASFGAYESVFAPTATQRAGDDRTEPRHPHAHPVRPVGPRDLPRLRPDGRGRVRRPRRPVPAARLRPLRAVGGRRTRSSSGVTAFCADLLAAQRRS